MFVKSMISPFSFYKLSVAGTFVRSCRSFTGSSVSRAAAACTTARHRRPNCIEEVYTTLTWTRALSAIEARQNLPRVFQQQRNYTSTTDRIGTSDLVGANTMNGSNKKARIETSGDGDAAKFEEVYHTLVNEIITEDEANPEIADAAKRFRKMLDYNVPHGKRNRGLTVINAFRHLAQPDQLTDDNVLKAMVMGWCVEWLQAYFLIADDIMDQSKTRRGQPCWFRQPDIGMDAINDSFYVEACIYKFLKRHILREPYYADVLELFHETTYQTVVGQSLDLITSPESNRDLNRFTQQRYDAIVKWKTAFYSFYLPVALAMYMVGIENEESHRNAKTILLTMGHFFQVQDDYLDCYGDPSVIGKIGTDIEENKCGWLVVQALQRVTPQQRLIIEENYGFDDASKVSKIKELYRELDITSVYKAYEEKSYQDLMQLIENHSGSLPKEMFVAYAKRIYKRQK
ncbi:LOW QUALITY PROTEIN: farnesyl pyrophosphate synthase-like [Amphiura filiformis]|uniref:LOW QUALITY PROTEIN: farnesyl pyrophosphate synthase-like n=1 Tax=Amphiura filiformis TaxID=82378 RepID=UPI003B21E1F1